MQFFHPNRPGTPDQPQYLASDGSPLAALQDLSVFPEPEGTFKVSVMLRVGRNEFRWFHHRASDSSSVAALVLAYVMDPEETLEQAFGYSRAQAPRHQPKLKPSTPLTLSDLGLA